MDARYNGPITKSLLFVRVFVQTRAGFPYQELTVSWYLHDKIQWHLSETTTECGIPCPLGLFYVANGHLDEL